jgi:hypothetical protein
MTESTEALVHQLIEDKQFGQAVCILASSARQALESGASPAEIKTLYDTASYVWSSTDASADDHDIKALVQVIHDLYPQLPPEPFLFRNEIPKKMPEERRPRGRPPNEWPSQEIAKAKPAERPRIILRHTHLELLEGLLERPMSRAALQQLSGLPETKVNDLLTVLMGFGYVRPASETETYRITEKGIEAAQKLLLETERCR